MSLKSLIVLSFVLLGFMTSSIAQNAVIKGQLIGANKEKVEYVNVLLLAATDSSLLKMELSDENGRYRFTGVEAGSYRLKVTGIGYSDTFGDIFPVEKGEEKVLPLMELASQAQQLNAVEVVARKPLLEQKAGMLVVNVENNLTGQSGSVTDLLKKVPGLMVVSNRVSMAGRSGVTILIDGRPTKHMDIQSVLQEMPAENIAKIEVITQPGSSMDAEGNGGVINIVLKKNALFGTNGSVSAGIGYGELPKYRTGLQLNHRTGPWNITSSLGYNSRSWVEGLTLNRYLPGRNFIQKNREEGTPNSFNARLAVDYDINDKHRVGISTNGVKSRTTETGINTTLIKALDESTLSDFTSTKMEDRSWRSFTTDLFYDWKMDTSGQELSIDVNFADYNRLNKNTLTTVGADFPGISNRQPAKTNIYGSQIDYTKPFAQYWNVKAGVKVTATRLDNEQDGMFLINNGWVRDSNSTEFEYTEDIYAAYTSVQFTKGKWDANIGLRYEDSQAEGHSFNDFGRDTTIALDIAKFFPSVSITTPFIGPLGASFSYSYRIKRPGYFDLNPFQYFLDPLTFSKGNPFLRPELTHSGQISLTYEKQPFFNLSYDRTNNSLAEVIEQNDDTGEAFQTKVNLDRYTKYGGSLYFPLDFIYKKAISGYGGVMVFYHDYQSEYLGKEFLQNQWTTNAFLQMNVKLPAKVKLEVTGWLQGTGLDGIIRYETFYGLDAGIQRKFLNDKLDVQLSVDGIVQKFFNGRVDYSNLQFDIVSEWEAPVANLRLSYAFGNQEIKQGKSRKSVSESERSRAQDGK